MQDSLKDLHWLRTDAKKETRETFRDKFWDYLDKLIVIQSSHYYPADDGYDAMGQMMEQWWTILCELWERPHVFVAQKWMELAIYVSCDITIYRIEYSKSLVTA